MTKGICNTLVFYDIDHSRTNIKGWYEFILDFFNKHQQMPDRASVHGIGIPQTGKTKTFKHCEKILRAKDFKDINYIWFASYAKELGKDSRDSTFEVEVDIERNPVVTLCFDSNIICYNSNLIIALAKEIPSYFNTGYGIFYQRDFNQGPSWYARGIISGLPRTKDFEEARRKISKWMHIYGDPEEYQHGDLRDIYLLNFISQAHLDRAIGAKTLKDWILASDKHGTLSPLTDKLWTWEVPQENIEYVREELRPTGIVKCI
jgi:hypothetical protein